VVEPSTPALWEVERTDGVVVALYNNPPMNYMTGAALEELGELLAAWSDPAVRAIVLAGAVSGRFVTHFSVEELLTRQPQLAERGPEINYRVHALFQGLNELPKPVIAAMNGDTMGVGFELSLSADIRIGQRGDFRYGLPEVRLGLIPGGTGTQRLARLIGAGNALNLILRAQVLTPEESFARGLVHELADDALALARAIAERLARMPATAMATAKRSIYQASDLPLATALRMEADASFRAKLVPESTEAMERYVAVPFQQRRDWLDVDRDMMPDPGPRS
jgi:enoyl-CoA hydratase/carnithine racemase